MAHAPADDRTQAAFAVAGALLLAGAAILAGCVQQREPAPLGGSPNLDRKEGFFFNDDPERAALVYGEPNSDSVDVMLACRPGSRRIDISDLTHASKGETLMVSSGRAAAALTIRVEADEAAGDQIAVADASSGLSALAAFRRTGQITLKLGRGKPRTLTASKSELVDIARFFAVCEKK